MTLTQLITSARYDIRDPEETDYTTDELFEYAKRAISQLDYALSSIGSDLVAEQTTSTLSSGDNSVSVPTDAMVVTQIWESQTQIYPLTPLRQLLRERQYRSSSGRPYYWSQKGNLIYFDATADQDYTLTINYDKRHNLTSLVESDDVPYTPEYDNAIREAVVLQCKHRNEFGVGEDGALLQFFSNVVMAKSIYKRYTPVDALKLDF